MKRDAFIWIKYYLLLDLRQQLNFEYFDGYLCISILELGRNILKLWKFWENGAVLLNIQN